MSTINLKLLIDTKAKKVLFAEANKEFVDFLFHIMSLPVATIVKLLGEKDMVGCLGLLYKSIESLDVNYLQANVNRDSILNPQTSAASVPLLALDCAPTNFNKYYCCGSSYTKERSALIRKYYRGRKLPTNYSNNCRNYVTDDPELPCPQCGRKMSTEMSYVGPNDSIKAMASSGETNSYVKGVVTYIVMDDLEVKTMSTISCLSLLNKFKVIHISSLVEKEVLVSPHEGVAILKASLKTGDVLTTVFLGKN